MIFRSYLWLLVSIPVPITSPPTVRSSNSGTIGIVQPSLQIGFPTRTFVIEKPVQRVSELAHGDKRLAADCSFVRVYLEDVDQVDLSYDVK